MIGTTDTKIHIKFIHITDKGWTGFIDVLNVLDNIIIYLIWIDQIKRRIAEGTLGEKNFVGPT